MAVSQNSLKCGVFSKQILLEGESKKEFEALTREFYEQFQPRGFLEHLLCERALAAAWRLSRVTQMETMLIERAANSFDSRGLAEVLRGYDGDQLTLLSRYEISLERVLFRSLTELRGLQSLRKEISLNEPAIGFVPQNLVEESIEENVI